MKKNVSSTLTLILVLFALTQSSFAQKTITGAVFDENGSLPGATIAIKGTANGTQTDFDGNYTINNVSPTNILVFSYVGYKPKEVTVGAQNSIDVVLELDNTLEEVVVVGYGVQKKSSITSSVATIKADDLAQVPLATFDQILQGRLTGIEVSSGSGQPGTPARIRIRGTSSILGNSTPLYKFIWSSWSGRGNSYKD